LCAQQELPHVAFLNILDSALKLDMPKLQACCERHIAVDPCGHFTALEMAEHLPSESALRIGDARRKAFLNLKAQLLDFVQKKDYSPGWSVAASVYESDRNACRAFEAKVKCGDLSKYIPSPMEFLKMAAAS